MKISQMPEEPRTCMAWRRPSQRLKGPTTLTARIGRPHREARALEPVERHRVRAQLVVDGVVVALAEEVQVEVGELRGEVVGVVLLERVTVAVVHAQPVRMQRAAERHAPLEQARLVDAFQHQGPRAVVPAHLDRCRVGLERAHQAQRLLVLAGDLVVAQQRARLGVAGVDQRVDVSGGELLLGGHRGGPPYITGLIRQMRCAYSRMLRSLEKMPMLSVFSTALRVHASGSR